jgi:rRNA maturation endonuclease Nob1
VLIVSKGEVLLYERRNKNAAAGDKYIADDKSVSVKQDYEAPKYWYQCRNCKTTIRKTNPPSNADCFKAVDHVWTQIAEVGNIKYLCRNCSTMIEAKAEPVCDNCPDAAQHDWERLG